MTIQLFYHPSQVQQWIDDARVTRGIAFEGKLPDGSKCYSIRTSKKMAENLTIEPCTDWKELCMKTREQLMIENSEGVWDKMKSMSIYPDFSAGRLVSDDAFKNCNPMPILNGTNSNINNLYP